MIREWWAYCNSEVIEEREELGWRRKRRRKKKIWGRGRINEWMTDAMDRSPLTEETDGDCQLTASTANIPPFYKDQTELDFPTVAACTSAQQPISGFIHRGKQEEPRYWGPTLPLGSSRLPIGMRQTQPALRVVTIFGAFSWIFCLLGVYPGTTEMITIILGTKLKRFPRLTKGRPMTLRGLEGQWHWGAKTYLR